MKEIDIELEEVDEDNTAVETNKEDKDKDNVNNKEDSKLLSDNLTFQPSYYNMILIYSQFFLISHFRRTGTYDLYAGGRPEFCGSKV